MTKRKQSRRAANLAAPRKIWLAGLGLAAVARQQGEQAVEQIVVRVGDTRKEAQRKVDAVVKPVQARAVDSLKRIEVGVANQVGAVLGRIGVPSKNEVNALLARVDQLSRQVKAKARAAR